MVIKCPQCEDSVELKPVGMAENNQFLYDFSCPTCGVVDIAASILAYANWDNDYVNRRLYPVVTQYIGKMLTCDIKCVDCEFLKKCYRPHPKVGRFFYDIDKDELRAEQHDDDN